MSKNQSTLFAAIVVASFTLFAVVSVWWLNQGYGEVSPLTYEYSKALYSACNNKNEKHLDKAEELLAKCEIGSLPAHERVWLEEIVAEARAGRWEAASKEARRMMEDQVQF